IIRALKIQTDGQVSEDNFKPPGCENAWCSFHGNFVAMPDGRLIAWTQHRPHCGCQPASAAAGAVRTRQFVSKYWSGREAIPLVETRTGPSLGGWDELLARARTHAFSISGMAFQDAWNLDLERLRDCCIHTVSPDGRIIPFCAYNLTDRTGRPLYRRGGV
ncbi:MAG: radical SAM protein, partial [Chloroflexota bacterium]